MLKMVKDKQKWGSVKMWKVLLLENLRYLYKRLGTFKLVLVIKLFLQYMKEQIFQLE